MVEETGGDNKKGEDIINNMMKETLEKEKKGEINGE